MTFGGGGGGGSQVSPPPPLYETLHVGKGQSFRILATEPKFFLMDKPLYTYAFICELWAWFIFLRA